MDARGNSATGGRESEDHYTQEEDQAAPKQVAE